MRDLIYDVISHCACTYNMDKVGVSDKILIKKT